MTPKQILLEYNIDAKEHSGLLEFVIEQYSNIKITELKNKVLEFRNMLKHFSSQENNEADICEYLLYQFEKDFNLENEKK